jgi:prepilin-type N-terminal cleavage/methylation domain-containing protein
MSRIVRDERGFTLIELMLVCVLFLVVMGASMTAFVAYYRSNQRAEVQHDHAEAARVTLDDAARQLRNLANPQATGFALPATIQRAEPVDLIFQTADPAKRWVRYCLDTESDGASLQSGRLWRSESAGDAFTAAMGGSCPGTDWATSRIAAEGITNLGGGVADPIFTYECKAGSPAGCPAGAADYTRISQIGIDVFVDADITDNIRELQVSTGVYLRNQNEKPVAAFTTQRKATRTVILNASGSADPEGRTLEYIWMRREPTAADLDALGTCQSVDPDNTDPEVLPPGIALTYEFPATDPTLGTVDLWLVVRDPGCLFDVYHEGVTVPT